MTRRPALLLALLVALPAAAQQSLWNVPAGTGTARGGFFFQEQLNLTRSGESNLTTAIGVGKGLELGLNIFHVHLYGDRVPETARNKVMVNAVYTFDVTDFMKVQLGGHGGLGRDEHLHREVPAGFAYLLTRFHFEELRLATVVGAYAASESYLGKGWPAGPMLGVEYELVPEWLVVQADLLLGNHEAAVGVIGAALLLPGGWQVAVGLQVPSPFSHNNFGCVVELTHVPPGAGDVPEDLNWQEHRVHPKWIREHRERHGEREPEEAHQQPPEETPGNP
ncbi:MAG: hypothetical protein JNK82_37075 [Myxococcaceae bacterium]|nr:hypothetical protein [Myxococcaceae bacterium]